MQYIVQYTIGNERHQWTRCALFRASSSRPYAGLVREFLEGEFPECALTDDYGEELTHAFARDCLICGEAVTVDGDIRLTSIGVKPLPPKDGAVLSKYL